MVENILLITVDSLRLDHFHDLQLSEDDAYSDIFSKAFATGPGTSPSFPALLTGTMPLSYGGLGPLREDRPRVSSQLQSAGLETAGFQCNPFLSRHFNYDHGFDTFHDYQNPLMGIATKLFPRGIEINNPKLERIDRCLHVTEGIKKVYEAVKGKPRPYVSADVITDDTISWLNEVDSPFFCWSHYMDVHHPCYPPESYRNRLEVGDITQSSVSKLYSALLRNPDSLTNNELEKLRRLYRAAIRYTGDQIRRILESLEKSGRYEDTLIILTSDHGELFGEYGQYGKPERMYDELIQVPLIVVNGPEYLREATDELVSLLDIPPVIYDVLGLDIPDVYEGQLPGGDTPRKYVMAEHEVDGQVIIGARSDSWLYEADNIEGELRLFEITDDEFERVQIEKHIDEIAEIRNAVNNRLESLDITPRQLDENLEKGVESRLEDLGYL